MSAQARLVLPAVAALAASLVVPMLSPNNIANAAEPCLTAPKGPAPQGSHWYYRLEHPSKRKCWRLVQKDQKEQTAQTALEPQGDEAAEETVAPAQNKPAPRVTEVKVRSVPVAPADNAANAWVTKNVSDTTQAAPPVQAPDPSANAMQRAEIPSTPALPERTTNNTPAPATIIEQPVRQPIVAPATTANVSAPTGIPTLRLVLAAIALLGFLACAVFFIMEILRRRADVLNVARDANVPAAETTPEAPAATAPTFAPLPPMELIPRHDDVEDALRRFTQSWKHRAA